MGSSKLQPKIEDGRISHYDMARYLMSRGTFKTVSDTNEVLVYLKRKGLYEFGGDKIIGKLIEKKLSEYGLSRQASRRYVDEVIGHIQRSTYISREKLNSNTSCINLNNGILDLNKMELWEHHPRLLSTVRIPVEFDPDAECPLIDNFFEEIVLEEQIPLLQEIFGWCLDMNSPIQRTILLIGEGANGKSTFLNLLRTFLGPRNCTAIALQDLSTNRFATSRLFGKLANICADLPKTTMKDTSSLKQLTGTDAITAEEKFQKSFEFVNRAKLIFSANRSPIIEDNTKGLWRRIIICEFPNEFTGKNDNKRLLEELTGSDELSGLLNIAIKGLKRLRKNGDFTYDLSWKETMAKYTYLSDSVRAFVEDRCVFNSDTEIPKPTLFQAYRVFCNEKHVPTENKRAFGRILKKRYYGTMKERQNNWTGITLKKVKKRKQ